MSIRIETPPADTRQLYAYLYRLSQDLNVALNSLDAAVANQSAYRSVNAGGGESGDPTLGSLGSVYNRLRSLIINTAEVIRQEMDVLEVTLNSRYEAVSSQWGTFRESIQSTITATAAAILQELNYEGSIAALQAQAAGFSQYMVRTQGYIKSGFIDYDEQGVPIIGIAVGQGLTSTTVTIDGVTYEHIDPTVNCAFYTATGVHFRINGQEVAHMTNRRLYIGDVDITGAVVLGDKWMISTGSGLKIKWIGGTHEA